MVFIFEIDRMGNVFRNKKPRPRYPDIRRTKCNISKHTNPVVGNSNS